MTNQNNTAELEVAAEEFYAAQKAYCRGSIDNEEYRIAKAHYEQTLRHTLTNNH